jgi:hypothetical protein
LLLAGFVTSLTLLETQDLPGAPGGERAKPATVLKSTTLGKVTVHYLTIPWGPYTFAAMEAGDDSFYAKRTWPFARLETPVSLTLDGTRLAPGNYALVFHPQAADKKGMSLEVRKIAVAEFLEPGNAMTRTPEGETLSMTAIQFERVKDVAPALGIDLARVEGGASLVIRYGDRQLTRTLVF